MYTQNKYDINIDTRLSTLEIHRHNCICLLLSFEPVRLRERQGNVGSDESRSKGT